MQQLLLFESGPIVIQVVFSFLLLWTISWWVGFVATILVIVHLSWSLYLNYHVARDTDPIEKEFRAQSRQMHERWEKLSRVKTSG